jgi:transcriptional regulator with XRE-family HTH domain
MDSEPLDDQAALASRLKESRLFLGLTQVEVAAALGMSRPSLADIEAGRRKVYRLELRRFGRLYHRSVAWLLGDGELTTPEAQALEVMRDLAKRDRQAVLRFAEFLAQDKPLPAQADKESR